MADIQCPHCGRENPDFLDTCQFCQNPLRPESTLHTGDSPVKKNTGELEPILPQWLKDVRQQARESAEEEAAASAAKPNVRNEPPDLLAGLASQSRADQEEIPDWLANINPITKPKSTEQTPTESPSDFFSQFNKGLPESAAPRAEEPASDVEASWMSGAAIQSPVEGEKDELSDWFAKAAIEPNEPIEFEHEPSADGMDLSSYRIKAPEPPKEQEDLSWLHSLEATASQPERPVAPAFDLKQEGGFEPTSPAEGEDLSWLNQLGAMQADVPAEPAPFTPAATPEPLMPDQASTSPNDLSWLDQLGDLPPSIPQEAGSIEPALSEVSDWMQVPGEQPSTSKEKTDDESSWLQTSKENESPGSTPERVSPFVPRRTGPLDDGTEGDMPDWLKSATEEPSMPPPGALSDWFRETSTPSRDETLLSKPQFAPVESDYSAPSAESPSSSSGEVDSLLSGGMPDWFSSSDSHAEESPATTPVGDDSLAPVDLPAWVQAMRPVESVIEGAGEVESQPTEREGPLAGLRGVIPAAPIGSAKRPKALSLKLQASEEQQAGAALLEQILLSETNPKPLHTSDIVASQRTLRWILSGLIILILSTMIILHTQSMPVSAILPAEVRAASGVIARLPQNSPVLVVIDYEPALAAELEAVSGPMLDQLVLSTHARLDFVSTSLNGPSLVRRLLVNTGISVPAPNGLDYKPGENYMVLGYLPGGFTGVRGFIESPAAVLPQAGVSIFSDYAAVLVLTDHAESSRVWVEQLYARNQADPTYFSFQPILFASSAQAAPMLQPYVSSGQITGMVSGLADAARYEFVNNSRPGIARRYWDSFGVGLMMAVAIISIGSLWSLVVGIRARRAGAGLG